MEMERKLDWTMLRKKVEIQDALGKQTSVRLRFEVVVPLMLITTYRQHEHYEYFLAIHRRTRHGNARGNLQNLRTLRMAQESRHGRSRLRAAYWMYVASADGRQ